MDKKDFAALITDLVNESPLNRAQEIGLSRIYSSPLVGIASAHDPLFARLKEPEVVGPHYLSPTEWLSEAETVISYFIPYSPEVRQANYNGDLPAREWLYGRIEGEAFNDAVRRTLVAEVQSKGGLALAPLHDARYKTVKKRSNWSERHTAYISGLGTFGLGKSLITELGSAGRFGSVVVSWKIEPTPRTYTGIYDNCTMCRECIPRCPIGAITENGKDIWTCSRYLDEIKVRYAPRYGCGKCQTAVACEYSVPGR